MTKNHYFDHFLVKVRLYQTMVKLRNDIINENDRHIGTIFLSVRILLIIIIF